MSKENGYYHCYRCNHQVPAVRETDTGAWELPNGRCTNCNAPVAMVIAPTSVEGQVVV
jgi:hypothetical protein